MPLSAVVSGAISARRMRAVKQSQASAPTEPVVKCTEEERLMARQAFEQSTHGLHGYIAVRGILQSLGVSVAAEVDLIRACDTVGYKENTYMGLDQFLQLLDVLKSQYKPESEFDAEAIEAFLAVKDTHAYYQQQQFEEDLANGSISAPSPKALSPLNANTLAAVAPAHLAQEYKLGATNSNVAAMLRGLPTQGLLPTASTVSTTAAGDGTDDPLRTGRKRRASKAALLMQNETIPQSTLERICREFELTIDLKQTLQARDSNEPITFNQFKDFLEGLGPGNEVRQRARSTVTMATFLKAQSTKMLGRVRTNRLLQRASAALSNKSQPTTAAKPKRSKSPTNTNGEEDGEEDSEEEAESVLAGSLSTKLGHSSTAPSASATAAATGPKFLLNQPWPFRRPFPISPPSEMVSSSSNLDEHSPQKSSQHGSSPKSKTKPLRRKPMGPVNKPPFRVSVSAKQPPDESALNASLPNENSAPRRRPQSAVVASRAAASSSPDQEPLGPSHPLWNPVTGGPIEGLSPTKQLFVYSQRTPMMMRDGQKYNPKLLYKKFPRPKSAPLSRITTRQPLDSADAQSMLTCNGATGGGEDGTECNTGPAWEVIEELPPTSSSSNKLRRGQHQTQTPPPHVPCREEAGNVRFLSPQLPAPVAMAPSTAS